LKKIAFILVFVFLIVAVTNIGIDAVYIENATSPVEKTIINVISPPYPASNPIPANNSINSNLSITLAWIGGDPDGDQVSYNVFFGTNPNPPNVEVVYRSNIYNPGILQYNTQYYWRIDTYADNGGATSGPVWTFSTKDDTAPYTPSTPHPNNYAVNIERNITLNWTGGDPDGDSVTYDIYFGTISQPPNVILAQNETEFTPAILEYNTTYYWKINATDTYGYTSIGPIWRFTTKDNTPPYAPSNPTPSNNSTDVHINSILSWSGGDPDNDNVTYNVYLGTNSNLTLEAEGINETYYTPSSLDYLTTYYWRVEATDEYGYSTNGSIWHFTTRDNAAPFIPSDPIPANESTNVYIDAILSWQGGDPDNDTMTYDVYFGEVETPPKVASNISNTTFEPTIMNTTTTYYWRIVSWDEHGHFTSSPVWNFRTSIYTNSPPEKPSRPNGPTSGRTGISYTYSSSTTDSNGEPIFYKFDWDDGSESDWLGPYNSGQTIKTSHIWRTKGNYAVKVKAKDIYGGESFWSDPLSISMPKGYETNLIINLLSRVIARFPFIQILF